MKTLSVIVAISIITSLNAQSIIERGLGYIAGENILHPNGLIFDQILMTGPSITLRAKPGNVTRVSFMDETEDIVQVEFFGTGTFTVTLDPTTYLPPSLPPRYNQQVEYVTGKPSVVIEGADQGTFLSIFTVGKINAVNQALFPEGQVYDGQADVKLVEIRNSSGMGGLQLANVIFSGDEGKIGINAPNVPISARVILGDIKANGIAEPHLLFGKDSFFIQSDISGLIIAGGNLNQPNGLPVTAILEASNLTVTDNVKSNGEEIQAKPVDRGNFSFIDVEVIDRQPVGFAPQSLNDKRYSYHVPGTLNLSIVGYAGLPNVAANGGLAVHTTGMLLGDILYTAHISGLYYIEEDADAPNTINVVILGQDAALWIDGVPVFEGTIAETSIFTGLPVRQRFAIKMIFNTPSSGGYSMFQEDNVGNLATQVGTFEQL